MRVLIINLMLIAVLGIPGALASEPHTKKTSEFNLSTLEQIENLIRKKAGAELTKNSVNSFTLNGHSVYTEVVERRFGLSVYEESFYDIKNPEREYRLRIVKDVNGDREIAVMIQSENDIENYHACFDIEGNMFEEDPWGKDENYTIEIFNLYNKYRNIYAQKVDAITSNQENQKIFLAEEL